MPNILKWFKDDVFDAETDKWVNEELIDKVNDFLAFVTNARLKRIGKGCFWIECGDSSEILKEFIKKCFEQKGIDYKDPVIQSKTHADLTVYLYKYQPKDVVSVGGVSFTIKSRNGGPCSFNPQYKLEPNDSGRKTVTQNKIESLWTCHEIITEGNEVLLSIDPADYLEKKLMSLAI